MFHQIGKTFETPKHSHLKETHAEASVKIGIHTGRGGDFRKVAFYWRLLGKFFNKLSKFSVPIGCVYKLQHTNLQAYLPAFWWTKKVCRRQVNQARIEVNQRLGSFLGKWLFFMYLNKIKPEAFEKSLWVGSTYPDLASRWSRDNDKKAAFELFSLSKLISTLIRKASPETTWSEPRMERRSGVWLLSGKF